MTEECAESVLSALRHTRIVLLRGPRIGLSTALVRPCAEFGADASGLGWVCPSGGGVVALVRLEAEEAAVVVEARGAEVSPRVAGGGE